MTGVFLDPVEDGKPGSDVVIHAGAVVMFALALLRLSEGAWFDGVENALWAALLLLLDATNRRSWMNGYYAAARSAKRQANEVAQSRD